MVANRPFVLSVAGFDPSAGAGVLADIKTFEQHGVYGLGVLTANTIQSASRVYGVNWMPVQTLLRQIEVLMDQMEVNCVKIGIMENARSLMELISFLKSKNPEIRIVWDPVLKSTSGYPFFEQNLDLKSLLKEIYLITPNWPEFQTLIQNHDQAIALSAHTAIYLKGGHLEDEPGVDTLYARGEVCRLLPGAGPFTPKHGSGCILSSAICANLALNHSLPEACTLAKSYIERMLCSNSSLLSWHVHD